MIKVFYAPDKGIYLGDKFNPKGMQREFEETGQVTVLFQGPAYPTQLVKSIDACLSVSDQIVKKIRPYLGDPDIKTGAITQTSTETLSDGNIGVRRIVFQIIPG